MAVLLIAARKFHSRRVIPHSGVLLPVFAAEDDRIFAHGIRRRRMLYALSVALPELPATSPGELGLKGVTLVRGLVGFNLGVEIGQLIFVAILRPALIWLSRGRGAWLTPRIASVMVALIGTYWLVERILVG
ncbi:MAG: HupE/UreJ family protein [Bradyrhizobium sp.]